MKLPKLELHVPLTNGHCEHNGMGLARTHHFAYDENPEVCVRASDEGEWYPREAVEAHLIEREAELIYLRLLGKHGARWEANESKDVWREKAKAALRFDTGHIPK